MCGITVPLIPCHELLALPLATNWVNNTIQVETSAELRPSVPNWFGEITLLAQHWKRHGVVTAIEDQVRLARRRFGTYEVIDFVVMRLGYASSGERTLKTLSERVLPFKAVLMGLFGWAKLLHRSTLSRFLACRVEDPVLANTRRVEKNDFGWRIWDRCLSSPSQTRQNPTPHRHC